MPSGGDAGRRCGRWGGATHQPVSGRCPVAGAEAAGMPGVELAEPIAAHRAPITASASRGAVFAAGRQLNGNAQPFAPGRPVI